MPADTTFTLRQDIFKQAHPPVAGRHLHEHDVTEAVVDSFLSTVVSDAIGVSVAYGTNGVMSCIAFATMHYVLYIQFTQAAQLKKHTQKKQTTPPSARTIIQEKILCNASYLKLAFDAERLATALFLDHGLFVAQLIDLQSVVPKKSDPRHAPGIIMGALGGETTLNRERVIATFVSDEANSAEPLKVAMRAWASCNAATVVSVARALLTVPAVNTRDMDREHLLLLSNFVRSADRLHALKPTKIKNDVKAEFSLKSGGDINVELSRFKTRLRPSHNQKLVIELAGKDGGALRELNGKTSRVDGKRATIVVGSAVSATATIKSVYTVGREDPTPAETERTLVVLAVLQGRSTMFTAGVAQRIFGFEAHAKPEARPKLAVPSISLGGRELNRSQAEAVTRMQSGHAADAVVLVHGPPGTGKTSVIATYVCQAQAAAKKPPIWLVAQSNVAVKNVAEKLAGTGFLDFKLLVSKDFHYDWHEHLYEQIEPRVLRSDQFEGSIVGNERLLLDARVLLCTLSMFSNPRLQGGGFTRLVPVETVIVDEASQIELGDYLPMLSKFASSLKKLVFIGDDKQLAPFGQDDLGDLPSIFEMDHLRKDAVFLDTQYRMPAPIGAFISKHVYGGKLQTQHAINDRRACRLVDVAHGQEKAQGNSWVNPVEADATVVVARRLHEFGRTYRVITPYDSQRNLLEAKLKAAGLPWENRCFNVDSFQGNEEDYIIISVVRTQRVGFLKNLRRTNVMLSRCRRGMIVCANRQFLLGNRSAQKSLVGKMAAEWKEGWVSWRDLLAGKV